MNLRYCDGVALDLYGAIRRDCCDYGAASAVLAELQWIGVAGIGMALGVLGAVIVAKEGVV